MRYNFSFDVIKQSKKFFTFSILITLIGILTLAIVGLNFGVDFKAGTNMDIVVGKAFNEEALTKVFKDEGLNPLITIGDNNRATARFDDVLKDTEEAKVKAALVQAFGKQVSSEVNTVDPSIARELIKKAIIAVALASLGIIIYVSIRFEWRFAVAGIVALLHDAFIVVSVFSIFRFEVNLPFIVAVLTIIGYSINDTIVIFDRIRENLRFAKLKTSEDLADLVNRSVWQTMTRSINTVMTVLIAALCLFIFGSESIRLFSLAIIVGLVSGAYSSIFIASPIWLILKRKDLKKIKKAAA